jgi:methyl coenzyme M reductase alpha subunit
MMVAEQSTSARKKSLKVTFANGANKQFPKDLSKAYRADLPKMSKGNNQIVEIATRHRTEGHMMRWVGSRAYMSMICWHKNAAKTQAIRIIPST